MGFAAIPAMHDEDEPRRGSMLGWIIGLILVVVVAAAAFWFLAPPEMKAQSGIAEIGDSELKLLLTTSDRQRLASGNELLAISGRVINPTDRGGPRALRSRPSCATRQTTRSSTSGPSLRRRGAGPRPGGELQ